MGLIKLLKNKVKSLISFKPNSKSNAKIVRLANKLLYRNYIKEKSVRITISDSRLDNLNKEGYGIAKSDTEASDILSNLLRQISRTSLEYNYQIDHAKPFWVNLIENSTKNDQLELESAVFDFLIESNMLIVATQYLNAIPSVFNIGFYYSKANPELNELDKLKQVVLKNGTEIYITKTALKFL